MLHTKRYSYVNQIKHQNSLQRPSLSQVFVLHNLKMTSLTANKTKDLMFTKMQFSMEKSLTPRGR